MAVPSFVNPAGMENTLKPRCNPSTEALELPRESAKLELLALQTEATTMAALTRIAQFLAHDLRHHLSAVYVNAEFLSGPRIATADKGEMRREIRLAIHCMTDQLDSLILFTRTGRMLQPRRDSLKSILENSIQMVRSHPKSRKRHDQPAGHARTGRLHGWRAALQRHVQPAAERSSGC